MTGTGWQAASLGALLSIATALWMLVIQQREAPVRATCTVINVDQTGRVVGTRNC